MNHVHVYVFSVFNMWGNEEEKIISQSQKYASLFDLFYKRNYIFQYI